MTRFLMTCAAAALLATPVLAAPCRDAKGHFMKCTQKTVVTRTRTTTVKKATGTKCKDAKGRFTLCGTPGSKPA